MTDRQKMRIRMEDNNFQQENIKEEQNTEETKQIPDGNEICKFRGKIIGFLFLAITYTFIIGMMTVPVLMCKPAIYLYPEKTQKYEVKLDKSIKYNNVIPEYHNGWVVEAEPNGNIRDLQPKYTNCNKLPSDFGFEYAKKACEINKYPYIYWDGVQIKKPLPDKKEGFLVKYNEIENFLNEKADEIALIKDEKKEFVRYWTHKMQEKNWKYYIVYFLQNEEVDEYLPITLNPAPQNSNRVQIIIRKGKKNLKLEEQKLFPIIRQGSTIVEWGGVIKK